MHRLAMSRICYHGNISEQIIKVPHNKTKYYQFLTQYESRLLRTIYIYIVFDDGHIMDLIIVLNMVEIIKNKNMVQITKNIKVIEGLSM